MQCGLNPVNFQEKIASWKGWVQRSIGCQQGSLKWNSVRILKVVCVLKIWYWYFELKHKKGFCFKFIWGIRTLCDRRYITAYQLVSERGAVITPNWMWNLATQHIMLWPEAHLTTLFFLYTRRAVFLTLRLYKFNNIMYSL